MMIWIMSRWTRKRLPWLCIQVHIFESRALTRDHVTMVMGWNLVSVQTLALISNNWHSALLSMILCTDLRALLQTTPSLRWLSSWTSPRWRHSLLLSSPLWQCPDPWLYVQLPEFGSSSWDLWPYADRFLWLQRVPSARWLSKHEKVGKKIIKTPNWFFMTDGKYILSTEIWKIWCWYRHVMRSYCWLNIGQRCGCVGGGGICSWMVLHYNNIPFATGFIFTSSWYFRLNTKTYMCGSVVHVISMK